jgi:hypothetical protein
MVSVLWNGEGIPHTRRVEHAQGGASRGVARTLPLTASKPPDVSYVKYLTKDVAVALTPSISWAMSSCPWSA